MRVIDYAFLIGVLALMQAWSSRHRSWPLLGKTAVVHHACDIAISLIRLPYIGRTAREVRMTPHTDHLKITYEDYQLIPDDGKRHEVIDGEHVISPSSRNIGSSTRNSLKSKSIASSTAVTGRPPS